MLTPQSLLATTCLAVPLAASSSAADSQAGRFTGYPVNDKKDIFTPITGRNYAAAAAAIPKPGAAGKPGYNGHKIQARDSSPQLYHEQVG